MLAIVWSSRFFLFRFFSKWRAWIQKNRISILFFVVIGCENETNFNFRKPLDQTIATFILNVTKKICPLCGHILIARLARSSQVWARLGRAIRSSRSVILDRRAARSGIFERHASRSVLCSSHTFKFISYNLILKLKPT